MKYRIVFFVFISFLVSVSLCYSETIVLESGKVIEAPITSRTDKYIEVNLSGMTLTYYLDEVKNIDGEPVAHPAEEKLLPKEALEPSVADSVIGDKVDDENIPRCLKALGYPESSWPAIERELKAFLEKIDFPSLKIKAKQARRTSEELKRFLFELGTSFRQQGIYDYQHPHPLMKSLVNSFGSGDILSVVEASPLSQERKEEKKRGMFTCGALSQLGFIVLDMLGIDNKTADAPEHAFNVIFLDGSQVLFVDFANMMFEIVDVDTFYRREGRYLVLKKEYRLGFFKIRELLNQWYKGFPPKNKNEQLNALYFYFNIPESNGATAGIYTKLGLAYADKGDFNQAISLYNKALEINPDLAESYSNRGNAYADKGNPDQAISDYNKVLEINPNLVGAYNNRATAYSDKGDFNQAISDCNKALELDPNLAVAYCSRGNAYQRKGDLDKAISDYNEALWMKPDDVITYYNRGNAYFKKDNFDQAISDYNKALELDPNLAAAYHSRATAYFYKKQYGKSWDDVHKAQALGFQVNPQLLEQLRRASGREE